MNRLTSPRGTFSLSRRLSSVFRLWPAKETSDSFLERMSSLKFILEEIKKVNTLESKLWKAEQAVPILKSWEYWRAMAFTYKDVLWNKKKTYENVIVAEPVCLGWVGVVEVPDALGDVALEFLGEVVQAEIDVQHVGHGELRVILKNLAKTDDTTTTWMGSSSKNWRNFLAEYCSTSTITIILDLDVPRLIPSTSLPAVEFFISFCKEKTLNLDQKKLTSNRPGALGSMVTPNSFRTSWGTVTFGGSGRAALKSVPLVIPSLIPGCNEQEEQADAVHLRHAFCPLTSFYKGKMLLWMSSQNNSRKNWRDIWLAFYCRMLCVNESKFWIWHSWKRNHKITNSKLFSWKDAKFQTFLPIMRNLRIYGCW